jgi:hypothetical protein
MASAATIVQGITNPKNSHQRHEMATSSPFPDVQSIIHGRYQFAAEASPVFSLESDWPWSPGRPTRRENVSQAVGPPCVNGLLSEGLADASAF